MPDTTKYFTMYIDHRKRYIVAVVLRISRVYISSTCTLKDITSMLRHQSSDYASKNTKAHTNDKR